VSAEDGDRYTQPAPGFGERGPRRNRWRSGQGARRAAAGGNVPGRSYPPRSDRHGSSGNGNPRSVSGENLSFEGDDGHDDDLEFLPRHIDPLQTNLHGRKRNSGPRSAYDPSGQPDPTKTSVDLMGKSGGGRNSNRGGRNNSRGGNKGGQGGGASHAPGIFPSGGKRF
jgi:ATP-dependent RNA helicase RhlE